MNCNSSQIGDVLHSSVWPSLSSQPWWYLWSLDFSPILSSFPNEHSHGTAPSTVVSQIHQSLCAQLFCDLAMETVIVWCIYWLCDNRYLVFPVPRIYSSFTVSRTIWLWPSTLRSMLSVPTQPLWCQCFCLARAVLELEAVCDWGPEQSDRRLFLA